MKKLNQGDSEGKVVKSFQKTGKKEEELKTIKTGQEIVQD